MMLRCIVALAFLSAAVSQPMQLTETMYEGGSCTADAKASATLPMGTCVAVSMAYREAWGLDAMTHMVVFHLDNSLEQCFASSQLLCETAMRDVVTSYIASFAWNSDLPGVATYPNTTSAVCASYTATAAELVGTCCLGRRQRRLAMPARRLPHRVRARRGAAARVSSHPHHRVALPQRLRRHARRHVHDGVGRVRGHHQRVPRGVERLPP